MNQFNKYISIGILFLISLLISSEVRSVSAMGMGRMMGMSEMMSMHKDMQMHNMVDKHFIEQMIPHHEEAILMAQTALEKSQRQEIRTLAQNIIVSQQEENQQMRDWYKTWFRSDVPAGSIMHGSDMEKLRDAEDFDKAFLEEMIPHHRMAIMMTRMMYPRFEHQELKVLEKK